MALYKNNLSATAFFDMSKLKTVIGNLIDSNNYPAIKN